MATPGTPFYDELQEQLLRERERMSSLQPDLALGRITQEETPQSIPWTPIPEEAERQERILQAQKGLRFSEATKPLRTSPQMAFDPSGSGYDYESARRAGLNPDPSGHWPSRDPTTGLLLKGKGHPTFGKTLEAEATLGNIVTERGGRLYSAPATAVPSPTSAVSSAPAAPAIEEPEQGFLTKYLSKPFVSIPLAVGAGVGSAFSPSVAKGITAGAPFLKMGLEGEAADFKRQQERAAGQSIAGMLDKLPPTVRVVVERMARFDPAGAAKMASQYALAEAQAKPTVVSPPAGGASILVDPRTGAEIKRYKGPEKEVRATTRVEGKYAVTRNQAGGVLNKELIERELTTPDQIIFQDMLKRHGGDVAAATKEWDERESRRAAAKRAPVDEALTRLRKARAELMERRAKGEVTSLDEQKELRRQLTTYRALQQTYSKRSEEYQQLEPVLKELSAELTRSIRERRSGAIKTPVTKTAPTDIPTAVNPETGQRIYLRNDRWEDEQGNPVE